MLTFSYWESGRGAGIMGTKHSFVYGEKVFLFITAVDVICSFS